MNNKWLKLAMVSFIGVIVSVFGLYFVQALGGANDHTAQMGSMQMDSSQLGNMNMGNGVTTDYNAGAQMGNSHGSAGMGMNVSWENQYYSQVQNQLNYMNRRMNQMRWQMNYIMSNMTNNFGPNGMNYYQGWQPNGHYQPGGMNWPPNMPAGMNGIYNMNNMSSNMNSNMNNMSSNMNNMNGMSM